MNLTLRRSLPWALSLLLHAALLLIPVRLGIMPRTRPEDRRIDLVFDQARAGSPAARLPSREDVALPQDAAPVAPRTPSEATLPSAVSGPAAPPGDRLIDLSSAGSSAFPTARDVLADLPVPGPAADSAAFSAAPADAAAMPLPVAGARIGWEGSSRKLIRRRDPQFPRVLSRSGQEVECVARITVTPAGTVSRVQVVQGSGYPEIDASVEAALRDYLFSRADGQTATATVSFRFRLERRD